MAPADRPRAHRAARGLLVIAALSCLLAGVRGDTCASPTDTSLACPTGKVAAPANAAADIGGTTDPAVYDGLCCSYATGATCGNADGAGTAFSASDCGSGLEPNAAHASTVIDAMTTAQAIAACCQAVTPVTPASPYPSGATCGNADGAGTAFSASDCGSGLEPNAAHASTVIDAMTTAQAIAACCQAVTPVTPASPYPSGATCGNADGAGTAFSASDCGSGLEPNAAHASTVIDAMTTAQAIAACCQAVTPVTPASPYPSGATCGNADGAGTAFSASDCGSGLEPNAAHASTVIDAMTTAQAIAACCQAVTPVTPASPYPSGATCGNADGAGTAFSASDCGSGLEPNAAHASTVIDAMTTAQAIAACCQAVTPVTPASPYPSGATCGNADGAGTAFSASDCGSGLEPNAAHASTVIDAMTTAQAIAACCQAVTPVTPASPYPSGATCGNADGAGTAFSASDCGSGLEPNAAHASTVIDAMTTAQAIAACCQTVTPVTPVSPYPSGATCGNADGAGTAFSASDCGSGLEPNAAHASTVIDAMTTAQAIAACCQTVTPVTPVSPYPSGATCGNADGAGTAFSASDCGSGLEPNAAHASTVIDAMTTAQAIAACCQAVTPVTPVSPYPSGATCGNADGAGTAFSASDCGSGLEPNAAHASTVIDAMTTAQAIAACCQAVTPVTPASPYPSGATCGNADGAGTAFSASDCGSGLEPNAAHASTVIDAMTTAQAIAACCQAVAPASPPQLSGCDTANMIQNADQTACVCPMGFAFNPAVPDGAAANCTACPAATFNDQLGTTTATTCRPCAAPLAASADRTACVCGGGFVADSGSDDSMRTLLSLDAPSCVCPAGFKYTPAGDAPATPPTCVACTGSTFSTAPGSTDCAACAAPKVVSSDRTACVCGPSFVDRDGTCECPAGFKFDAAAKTCSVCPAGTFNAVVGRAVAVDATSTSCNATCAAAGMAPNAARTGCACANNFVGSAADPAVCECPAGFLRNATDGTCRRCPAGRVSAAPDSATCEACPVAGEVPNAARTGCVCPKGFAFTPAVPDGAAANCSACPAATFNDQLGTTTATTCSACAAPRVVAPGGVACVCGGGFVPDRVDASQCVCPPGSKLTPASGETPASCQACPAGSFNEHPDAPACLLCPAPVKAVSGDRTACLCANGFKRDPNDPTACACPAGFALDAAAQTCRQCPAGTFNAEVGRQYDTACSADCPVLGQVPNGARTGCVCGAVVGANSFVRSGDACACPAGHEFDAAAGTCTACAAGSWNADEGTAASTFCKAGCPVDNMVPAADGTGCECPKGCAFTPASGDTPATCEPCPEGEFGPTVGAGPALTTCMACSPPRVLAADQTSCDCPAGLDWDGSVCVCGAGSYLQAGVCAKCPAGTYSDELASPSCAACPDRQVPSADQTSCLCAAGFFDDGTGGCQRCPAGTFSRSAGAHHCDACEAPGVLAADQSACACPAGHALDADSGDCAACPAGTWSDAPDALACRACPAGKVLAADASSCDCPAGSYADAAGEGACVLIPQQGQGESTATVSSTFLLTFQADFDKLAADAAKLSAFKDDLRASVARGARVPVSRVTVARVYKGSVKADVVVTAPADEATQAGLVSALVASPDALFDSTFKTAYDVTGPVAGTPTSTVVYESDQQAVRIGAGVGTGLGASLGIAGCVTALVVARRARAAAARARDYVRAHPMRGRLAWVGRAVARAGWSGSSGSSSSRCCSSASAAAVERDIYTARAGELPPEFVGDVLAALVGPKARRGVVARRATRAGALLLAARPAAIVEGAPEEQPNAAALVPALQAASAAPGVAAALGALYDGTAESAQRPPDLRNMAAAGQQGGGGGCGHAHHQGGGDCGGGHGHGEHHGHGGGGGGGAGLPAERAAALVKFNAFGDDYEDLPAAAARGVALPHSHVGLWPQFSLFNHACLPNAVHYVVGHCMVVRSVDDVPAGEELLVSYLGREEYSPAPVRQALLAERFGFGCACSRCALEADAPRALTAAIRSAYDAVTQELKPAFMEAVAAQDVVGLAATQTALAAREAALSAALAAHLPRLSDGAALVLQAGAYELHELLLFCEQLAPAQHGGGGGGERSHALLGRLGRCLAIVAAASKGAELHVFLAARLAAHAAALRGPDSPAAAAAAGLLDGALRARYGGAMDDPDLARALLEASEAAAEEFLMRSREQRRSPRQQPAAMDAPARGALLTFDEALTGYVGELGRGQQRVIALVSLLSIPNGLIFLLWVFLTIDPVCARAWACADATDAACAAVWARPTAAGLCGLPRGAWAWSAPNGSLVSRFDLVCAGAFKVQLGNSLFFIGCFLGSALCGTLSDRHGRKWPMFGATALAAAATLAGAAAPAYAFAAAARLVAGVGAAGQVQGILLLCLEVTGPSRRGVAAIPQMVLFTLGEMLLVALALALPDWRHLQLCAGGVAAAGLALAPFVPESPRWLLAQGGKAAAARQARGVALLRSISRSNASLMPAEHLISSSSFAALQASIRDADGEAGGDSCAASTAASRASSAVWADGAAAVAAAAAAPPAKQAPAAAALPGGAGPAPPPRQLSLLDLLRHRRVVVLWGVMMLVWAANFLSFYGIALGTGGLPGSIYLSFSVSAAAQLVATLAAGALVDRLGRTNLMSGALLLGGGACLACAGVGSVGAGAYATAQIVLAAVGQFGATASIAATPTYTAELFPTQVRSRALGACHVACRLGSISAPLLLMAGAATASSLGRGPTFLPFLLLGAVTGAAGAAMLVMPETAGRGMVDTIEDLTQLPTVFDAKPWRGGGGLRATAAFLLRTRGAPAPAPPRCGPGACDASAAAAAEHRSAAMEDLLLSMPSDLVPAFPLDFDPSALLAEDDDADGGDFQNWLRNELDLLPDVVDDPAAPPPPLLAQAPPAQQGAGKQDWGGQGQAPGVLELFNAHWAMPGAEVASAQPLPPWMVDASQWPQPPQQQQNGFLAMPPAGWEPAGGWPAATVTTQQSVPRQFTALAGGPPPAGGGAAPRAPAPAAASKPKAPSRRFRERQKEAISSMEAEVAAKLAQLQVLSAENEMLKLRAAVLDATVKGRDYHLRVLQEHGPPSFDTPSVSTATRRTPSGVSGGGGDTPHADSTASCGNAPSPRGSASGSGDSGPLLDMTYALPHCGGPSATGIAPAADGACGGGADAAPGGCLGPPDGLPGGCLTDAPGGGCCSEEQRRAEVARLVSMSVADVTAAWRKFVDEASATLIAAEEYEAAAHSDAATATAVRSGVSGGSPAASGCAADSVSPTCRWCGGCDSEEHRAGGCGPGVCGAGAASPAAPPRPEPSPACAKMTALVARYSYITKWVAFLSPGTLYSLFGRHLETGEPHPYTDEHWRGVVARIGLTQHQVTAILACAELYFTSLTRLLDQRRELQERLAAADPGLSECARRLGGYDGNVDQMTVLEALANNLKREHVLRIMLNCFVWGRTLTSKQFAQAAVYSYPFFTDSHAMVAVLYEDATALAGGQRALVFPHRQGSVTASTAPAPAALAAQLAA
ncbi:Orct2 [Scenedesmus sp. PABB004]|nr:Orct2 [Scenedesmus sp. PABB004]